MHRRVKIPMEERVQIALKEINKPGKPCTQQQLADCLGWNASTVQRVVNADSRILAGLIANRPAKRAYRKRPLKQKENLVQVVQQLFDAIQESGMTYTEIAHQSGMSQVFFRDIFVRGHLPRLDSLLAVCQVVGLEPQLVRVVK